MSLALNSEKRQYIRVKPNPKYPISIDVNGENYLHSLTVEDISQGGVGVSMPGSFESCIIDTPVSFVIDLPFPKPLLLRGLGRIKHVSDDRFGVVFEILPNWIPLRNNVALNLKEDSWFRWFKYKLCLIN